MSQALKEALSWSILIAILWDTILTVVLLRIAISNTKRISNLEKGGSSVWQSQYPTSLQLLRRDVAYVRQHLPLTLLYRWFIRIGKRKNMNNIQLLEYSLIGLIIVCMTILMAMGVVPPSIGIGVWLTALGYVFGGMKSTAVLQATNNQQTIQSQQTPVQEVSK